MDDLVEGAVYSLCAGGCFVLIAVDMGRTKESRKANLRSGRLMRCKTSLSSREANHLATTKCSALRKKTGSLCCIFFIDDSIGWSC